MKTQETPESRVEIGFSTPRVIIPMIFLMGWICLGVFTLPKAMNHWGNGVQLPIFIVFFTLGAIPMLWSIPMLWAWFKGKNALILNNKGIEIQYMYPMPSVFVPWDDVTNIQEAHISYYVFVVYISDNQSFINKQPNVLFRFLMQISKIKYGTPFVMSPSWLNKDHKFILELMRQYQQTAHALK